MSCRYCGTELPEEAVFCPECGHAVSSVSEQMPVAASTGISIADLAFSSPDAASSPVGPASIAARCPQCGEPVAEGDIFCGECGFVLRDVSTTPADAFSDASAATSIIVLPDLIALGAFPPDPEAPVVSGAEPTRAESRTDAEPVVFDALDALQAQDVPAEGAVGEAGAHLDAESAPDAAPPPDAAPAPSLEPELGPGPEHAVADEVPIDEMIHDTPAQVAAAAIVAPTDPDLEFDEPLPFALPIAKKPMPATRSRPIPDPFPWGTDSPLREDIEATRLIADVASGIRFVLQFSTGESVTVLGSGLVGRNPSMQPGEYVDQLVPIFDAGKSVSKTHLEYGQEGGRFWISDRYSTNGSTIRQPDTEPRRADPGRRYFVARGTRVDLGEQFFVVS